jgi:hypothetical protein
MKAARAPPPSEPGSSMRTAASVAFGYGAARRLRRWDPCFAACGWAFPGASTRTCFAFARDTRSQQSLLLATGVACFLVDFLLYPLNFTVFAIGLCVGSIIFAAGLVYDVLLIAESKRAADAARPTSAALADALGGRTAWRWGAFALNLGGTGLTVLGCVWYLRCAALLPPGFNPLGTMPPAAAAAVWRGNAWFASSFLCFLSGFAVVALDAMLTMRDVARATGQPDPSPTDEMGRALLAFFVGLSGLGTANTLILFHGQLVTACAAAAGAVGVTTVTWATYAQLRMQWRDFAAGAGNFWEQMALEEEAVEALRGGGAGAQQGGGRWFGGAGAAALSGGGRGADASTPLLGGARRGGAAPPPGRRGPLAACGACFGGGRGAAADVDAV